MAQSDSLLIYRSLEQQMPNFLRPPRRELVFENGSVFPVLQDLTPGIETISQSVLTEAGIADFIGDTLSDIPLVSLGMYEDKYPVYMVGAGYSFSWKSTRSLGFANQLQRVTAEKLRLVSRAIAERIHKFWAVGDPRVAQTGFLNSPLVTPRPNTFDPNDANISAYALRSFFLDSIFYPFTQSNYTRMPADIVISPKLYKLGIELIMPDTGNVTVLQAVQQSINSGDIGGSGPGATVNIKSAVECSAEYLEATGVNPPGTGTDRIVVYSRDEEVCNAHTEPLLLIPREWMGVANGVQKYGNAKTLTPAIIADTTQIMYQDIPSAL